MNESIILVGNPNVGKSTLFNVLTGMKEHTGNWTGKTVSIASNKCLFRDFYICDLPGTYSIFPNSKEEEIATDLIYNGNYKGIIVVCDASSLESNLLLVLRILEITSNVIVCINMIDEAYKKKININIKLLSYLLGVPVVSISAKNKMGIEELLNAVDSLSNTKYYPIKIEYDSQVENELNLLDNNLTRGKKIKSLLEKNTENKINFLSSMNLDVANKVDFIVKKVINYQDISYNDKNIKIDKIVTSKKYGIPIMLALLFSVFWITIKGANYPSSFLFNLFMKFENILLFIFDYIKIPIIITDILIFGVYRVLTWVISVMLPPMAIFFPLFTFLEDLGYLPRIAFNLDKYFKKCNTCGKQSLTMCMGFGCNAVGVMGCRIISSKKDRLISIITNSLVPCNGRFPTLITLITLFVFANTFLSSLALTLIIVFSILMTFLTSYILSKTLLKDKNDSFFLELPPYRMPKLKKVLVSSLINRTVVILKRAVIVAAPTGLLIWLLANIYINELSILKHLSNFLDPFANIMGLDGVILMAFILGFPANEIVIPIMIMRYMSLGHLTDLTDLGQLKNIFILNGWNIKKAICTLIFCLFHFPCSTTLLTIKKETNSWYWTFISFITPLLLGIILCILINFIF